MKRLLVLLASALLLALAGCSTTGSVATDAADDAAAREQAQSQAEARAQAEADERARAEARAAEERARLAANPLEDPDSPLAQRIVYFEFDSSELSAADMELLQAHAQYLSANPDLELVIEGHTDERGSREYNLALGERRANAVKRILTLNGVGIDQVESISFGEEKPVAHGQNEEAWRQNRRGVLVYGQQY